MAEPSHESWGGSTCHRQPRRRRPIAPTPLVAHVFPTFAVGGAQARFAAVANHFGAAFRHIIVSLDGNLACRQRLDPTLDVTFTTRERIEGCDGGERLATPAPAERVEARYSGDLQLGGDRVRPGQYRAGHSSSARRRRIWAGGTSDPTPAPGAAATDCAQEHAGGRALAQPVSDC